MNIKVAACTVTYLPNNNDTTVATEALTLSGHNWIIVGWDVKDQYKCIFDYSARLFKPFHLLSFHCTIILSFHCTIILSFHCTIILLFHCSVILSFHYLFCHFTALLFCHFTVVLFCHFSMILSFHCTVLLLIPCTINRFCGDCW